MNKTEPLPIKAQGFLVIKRMGAITCHKLATILETDSEEVVREIIGPLMAVGKLGFTTSKYRSGVFWYVDDGTYDDIVFYESGKRKPYPAPQTLEAAARVKFPQFHPEPKPRVRPESKTKKREAKMVALISERPGYTTRQWAKAAGWRVDRMRRFLTRLEGKGAIIRKSKKSPGRGRPSFVWYVKGADE